MEDPAAVAAFAEAGSIDGVMAAAYVFNTARVSQVIRRAGTVLDLGCGPAVQLAQIASVNPQCRFIGVDLSQEMLERARGHVAAAGLSNIEFVRDDITCLSRIPESSVEAVISTMTLHHLRSAEELERCFAQVRRVLHPGGAVYIIDFGRLKSLRSVLFFAYANARHQPHLFSLDYERSLRAAFLPDDFRRAAQRHFGSHVQVYTTFKVPLLIITKTPDMPLDRDVAMRIRSMRTNLARRYRRDLDDIRAFFRAGGLRNDPFAGVMRAPVAGAANDGPGRSEDHAYRA